MSEEIRKKIEDFVNGAENYQKLEISNLPNVVVQVFPDKKLGKVARVGIFPEGTFKSIVLTRKRFETIKHVFSNNEFVDKLDQLVQIVDDMYGKEPVKNKETTKIEV